MTGSQKRQQMAVTGRLDGIAAGCIPFSRFPCSKLGLRWQPSCPLLIAFAMPVRSAQGEGGGDVPAAYGGRAAADRARADAALPGEAAVGARLHARGAEGEKEDRMHRRRPACGDDEKQAAVYVVDTGCTDVHPLYQSIIRSAIKAGASGSMSGNRPGNGMTARRAAAMEACILASARWELGSGSRQCRHHARSPQPVMGSDCGTTIIVQEAGIPIKLASSIGVAVDHRRRNRSLEGLQVIAGFRQRILCTAGCRQHGAMPWL